MQFISSTDIKNAKKQFNKMRVLTILLIILSLSSCSTTGMENFMKELWVVNSVEYNGKKYENGLDLLLLNTLSFKAESKCEMPGWLKSRTSSEKGNWSIEKINGKYFLVIKGCQSEIYNSKYQIFINNDNPKLMTLESDSLKLICGAAKIL